MADVPEKKVVIVGGGFGGVRCALDLAKKSASWRTNVKIILISDKPHFEYHASLYRIVTGRSPLECCIPLREIFADKNVEVVEDTITKVDLGGKKLTGSSESHYSYDFLVLALGSETAYPDISGLAEFSFGYKSIRDALKLKRHLHEMFSSCVIATDKEKECALRFVIVGGGATGTELAGELAIYTKRLAKHHMLDQRLLSIDIIQGRERLLPSFSPEISTIAKKRLEELGVAVHLNKRILREDIETVYLPDMQMKTKTVIWTAGAAPSHLYATVEGLSYDEKGRIVVDEFLQPVLRQPADQGKAFSDVFIIGDGAATLYSGMAHTALHHGSYVAQVIASKIKGKHVDPYKEKKPLYAMPIGPNWAIFVNDSMKFFGRIGWTLRRYLDLSFFFSILPVGKALTAFQSGMKLTEQCPICSADGQ